MATTNSSSVTPIATPIRSSAPSATGIAVTANSALATHPTVMMRRPWRAS